MLRPWNQAVKCSNASSTSPSSAVDMTLKGGVEKTLLEQIPQLAGVRDNTDHSDRSQAYY